MGRIVVNGSIHDLMILTAVFFCAGNGWVKRALRTPGEKNEGNSSRCFACYADSSTGDFVKPVDHLCIRFYLTLAVFDGVWIWV